MDSLDSFELELTEPPAEDGSPVDGYGTRTWWIERPVGPGDASSIAFRAKALRRGTQQLAFNVCNEVSDCDEVLASIEVTATPSEGSGLRGAGGR